MEFNSGNTLRKKERLSGRKSIQSVFDRGRSFNVFPLRVIWLPENSRSALQAGFGVSARHFKKSVDRNRVKRLLKEAYRLQKKHLEKALLDSEKNLSIFFLFTGNEKPSFELMCGTMEKAISKLSMLISDEKP